MKKFFLALLAIAGMMTGMTLTSCGGGGSDSSVDLTDLKFTMTGNTPMFEITFLSRVGKSNNYLCRVVFGDSTTDGSFSVHPGYPKLSSDGNTANLVGNMGVKSANFAKGSTEVASFLGVSTNINYGIIINSPILVNLAINKADGNTAVTMSGNASGFDHQGNAAEDPQDYNKNFPNGMTAENYQRIFNILGGNKK